MTLLYDAMRFANIFAQPITRSTAHIYISVLPFTPRTSQIYKQYGVTGGCAIDVLAGEVQDWPVYNWWAKGHAESVTSVAFSPDDKQIVSGSDDHTLCVWDAASGQLARPPLNFHTHTSRFLTGWQTNRVRLL
jgi:WD40 repeat protein